MNSHSPVVLSCLEIENFDVMFANVVNEVDPTTKTIKRKTIIRPISRESELINEQTHVGIQEVERYLATVN